MGEQCRPAWRLAAAICFAVVLLAGCSSGGAQRRVAGPPSGTGAAPSLSQSSASAAGPAAKGRQSSRSGGKAGAAAKSGPAAGTFGSVVHPARLGPTRLDAHSAASVVANLPKPTVRSGPSLSFSPAIFMGPSILGDLGSSSWNITHRDADGKSRTWGSSLYVSSTSSNALAVLRHSPVVPHYCPKGGTPLAGFKKAATVTVALVCQDSNGVWWSVFQRADRLSYLVLATSDSTRAETVATGRAAFNALTAMVSRVNIGLGVFKPSSEPKG